MTSCNKSRRNIATAVLAFFAFVLLGCGISDSLTNTNEVGKNSSAIMEFGESPEQFDMEWIYDRGVVVEFEDDRLISGVTQLPGPSNEARFERVIDGPKTLARYRIDDTLDYSKVFARLKANPSVKRISPDYLAKPHFIPNDPYFNPLGTGGESYQNQWGLFAIGADRAWNVTTGSEEILVAVLDTGCQMDHPDLMNQFWINEDEIPGDGIDNDLNGYIDDVNGYDFFGYDSDPEDVSFSGFVYHGTSCAGIIGAQMGNANGVASVAGGEGAPEKSGVRIMVLRVGSELGLPYSSIVEGVKYAADNGARILSMSFGGPYGDFYLYDAMQYAAERGAVLFASSGNSFPQPVSYPAAFDNVIAVGATTQFSEADGHAKLADERITTFSSQGPQVELSAPGYLIVTTFGNSSYTNSEGFYFAGTSAACPFAAGAAALVLSYYPEWKPDELKSALFAAADDLGIPGVDHAFGYGRVNVANILGEDLPPIRPEISGTKIPVDKATESYVYKVVPFEATAGEGVASIHAGATLFDFSGNPDVLFLQANKAAISPGSEVTVTLYAGPTSKAVIGVAATIWFNDSQLEYLPASLSAASSGVFGDGSFSLNSYFNTQRPYEFGLALNRMSMDAQPVSFDTAQPVATFRFRAKSAGAASIYFQIPECGFTYPDSIAGPSDVGYIEVVVQ